MADRAHLKTLERKLADDGKLIEAGWIGLRLAAIPDNMPTDADLARLDRIEAELEAFIVDYELRRFPAEGKA